MLGSIQESGAQEHIFFIAGGPARQFIGIIYVIARDRKGIGMHIYQKQIFGPEIMKEAYYTNTEK